MTSGGKVLRYGARNLLRSWWVPGYAAVFLFLTESLLRFGGGGPRAVASLLNAVLIVIPLVSVVMGTMFLSGSREFILLLLAQPVSRRSLFTGLYFGVALPLAGAFLVGVGIPVLARGGAGLGLSGLVFAVTGVLLTFVFTALAFFAAARFEDRAKALGVALLGWFAATVLYDGLVLLVVAMFSDWPLETPMLALTLLNPVDLARVLLLLTFDVAALMGYTGAVFERFFGSGVGIVTALLALAAWTALPFLAGLRGFSRKDF
ncbi:MAG TPA: ABC transporter permease subunit [Gemmatimonadales bacterium]|nr:ABC transporter permease subunit [Gemmatimonadales bacterium]